MQEKILLDYYFLIYEMHIFYAISFMVFLYTINAL